MLSDQALFEALKKIGIIDEKALLETVKESQLKDDGLQSLLVKKGLISEENLGKLVADLLELPFIRLQEQSIEKDVLELLSESFAKENRCIAFSANKEAVKIGGSQVDDVILRRRVEKMLDQTITWHYATTEDVQETLLLYKKDAQSMFEDIISENIKKAKSKQDVEPPIISIVDTIISYAHERKASDIHLEPFDDFSLIRFRIDGILHDIVELPKDLHPRLITRIKVMAKLRTDEHQAAQDGKLQIELSDGSEEELDIRVSIIPSTDGEKTVMRLLSERSRRLSLEELGFSGGDLKRITAAYEEPHGMILATGPTGSGKTTTMYSILKLLNKRDVNISTIEDPVEYDIEGITQIQVNEKTNLSFAKGLRSIVRQDPDIVLVGEIRDNETADIAINAAMTGHLVLSTLHTNDAATTIPRLIDMEVEPFLIASTINTIVAQRLVRKIHLSCRQSVEVTKESVKHIFHERLLEDFFGDQESKRVYKGAGCSVCHDSGYEGRIGIYEILTIDDEIRQAIVERKTATEIKETAIKNGMTTILADGLEKVKAGTTTIEEILRVSKE